MKASTAETHYFLCPACGGRLAKDHQGRGFVRHITYGYLKRCLFEKGESDAVG